MQISETLIFSEQRESQKLDFKIHNRQQILLLPTERLRSSFDGNGLGTLGPSTSITLLGFISQKQFR